MAEITYKGWRLVTEEDLDGDQFIRYEHYACNETEQKHLGGSSFRVNFHPTVEIFQYLVDHNFPRSPSIGPWTNDELEKLIAEEKADEAKVCEPSGASDLVEREDEGASVVRDSDHSTEGDEG